MALQIEYTDNTGVTLPKAYCRVERLVLEPGRTPEGIAASWRVVIYRDEAARRDPFLASVTNREYRVQGETCAKLFAASALKLARIDPFSQAYSYTKTQAEWSGAANV